MNVLNWHAWDLNYNSKMWEFCNSRCKIASSSCFDRELQIRQTSTYPYFFQHCFSLRLISFPGWHLHILNISPQLLDMLLVGRLKCIPVFRVIPVPVCEWAHTQLWVTHALLLASEPLPSNFFPSYKTDSPIVWLLHAHFEV